MDLAHLKVGTRLGLGFALVLLLLVAAIGFGINNMAQIQNRLDRVVRVNNAVTGLVIHMGANISQREMALRTITLMGEGDDKGPEMARVKEFTRKYDEAQTKLEAKFAAEGSAEEKAFLAEIKQYQATAMPAIEKAALAWQENKPQDAIKIMRKEVRPVQKKWIETLDKLAALEDKLNGQVQGEASNAFNTARNFMLGLGVLALAMGIAAAVVITRGLLNRLGGEPEYTAHIAKGIAYGDLMIAIETKPHDTDSLLLEMKGMRDSLVSIVGQVRQGTEMIGTASHEIADGNADLSHRTDAQTTALEKIALAMDDLTKTVKQNAVHAREANLLAANASDVALKGGSVVSDVVQTMGSINQSAKKIADIIGVIDGIAFQTNILALNAAVEAARAGEQGRGFAVVATEVRNLAQRSAAAAKEIKNLISDSVEEVARGSKLVEQAGVTMGEVVESVKHVTTIMSEIANASEEQSSGIEQVNHSIIDMEGMTQQNAALADEAAAAAQSLQDQARDLAEVVSVFRLTDKEEAHGLMQTSSLSRQLATRAKSAAY